MFPYPPPNKAHLELERVISVGTVFKLVPVPILELDYMGNRHPTGSLPITIIPTRCFPCWPTTANQLSMGKMGFSTLQVLGTLVTGEEHLDKTVICVWSLFCLYCSRGVGFRVETLERMSGGAALIGGQLGHIGVLKSF